MSERSTRAVSERSTRPARRRRAAAGAERGAAAGDQLADLHLPQPAERALRGAGYDTLAKLAAASDVELLALHGVGHTAVRRIRQHAADDPSH